MQRRLRCRPRRSMIDISRYRKRSEKMVNEGKVEHFSWCDAATLHEWEEDGWVHDRLLGMFLPLHNDFACVDPRGGPFELHVVRHDNVGEAIVAMSIRG